MSREILDCLKRKQDICIKNIIPSQNTAFMFTPALTCIASKILEHIIHSHVMKLLQLNNILTDCKHGFRAKRSTESQLTAF